MSQPILENNSEPTDQTDPNDPISSAHQSMLDEYIVDLAPMKKTEADNANILDKIGREAYLVSSAVSGSFEMGLHNVWEDPGGTAVKAGSAFLFGLGLSLLTRRGSTAALIGQAIGTGSLVTFVADLASKERLATIGGAISDTWQSAGNLDKNIDTVTKSLGTTAFDLVLTTATGALGSRIGSNVSSEMLVRTNKRWQSLAETSNPGIVRIDTAETIGSGFAIKDGRIVTALHVVSSNSPIRVTDSLGHVHQAVVSASDDTLALLRIVPAEPAGPMPVVPSLNVNYRTLRVNEKVAAIGNPNLHQEPEVSLGSFLFKKTGRLPSMTRPSELLWVSTPVHGGISGSPLIDSQGNVIGIIQASLANNALATPSTALSSLLK